MKLGKIIEVIDIGNTVICDLCADDFTDSDEKGGFLFMSKGVCPHCAPDFLKNVKRENEEKYIAGYCPEDMTFRDWVLKLRGGNNKIITHSLEL